MPQFIPLENDLKRVVNSAPVIVFQIDKNGIFTLSEGAALKKINLKPGEAVGLSMYDLYKDYPLIINSIEKVLQTGEDIQFTVAISDTLFFDTKLTPVKQIDNEIVGVNGVSTDVSENHFLVDELIESEDRYRSFVESAPFGILVTFNTSTQFVNKKFAELFGYKDISEFDNKPNINFFAPRVRAEVLQKFINRAKGVEAQNSYETIGLRKDGTEFPLEITAINFTYQNKQAQMYFLQDITDKKKSEEQNKIMIKQLMQTQKLESLGILAGGIAHDFNNLLVGIMGYASLASSKIDPDSEIYELISKIEKTSKLASDLTHQMLNFSGKGQFKKEVLSLNSLIVENEDLFKTAVSKLHELSFNLDNDLPLVEVDTTQIRQVILNLLTNASEAIDHSHGKITVTLKQHYLTQESIGKIFNPNIQPGKYLILTVQDNGKGVTKEIIEKIFDPFFTTKTTGRGLGLSVVQGIIHGHNGAIKVESELDKGTLVTLCLPVKEGLQIEETKEVEEKLQENKVKSILICDDEETVLDVASKMLTNMGYNVLVAQDGLESISIYKNNQNTIDLILLDLTMPKLGGEEVFHKIREITPKIKIILSSGFNQKDVLLKFSDSELSGFLQKPYTYSDLINCIKNLS